MGGLTNDQLVTVYLSKVWSEEKAVRGSSENDLGFSVFPSGKCCWGEEGSDPPHIGAWIMRLSNLIFTKLPPRSSPCWQLANPSWWKLEPKSDCQSSPSVSVPTDLRIWKFTIQSWNCMDFWCNICWQAGCDKQRPPARREGINVNRQEWTCSLFKWLRHPCCQACVFN